MSLCYKISPYFQELQVYVGQQLDYQSAATTIRKLLVNAQVDDSQIHRLCTHYGNLPEISDLVKQAESNPNPKVREKEKEEEEITYVGVDGHFLLTDNKWEEVKLGRVFSSKDIVFGEKSPDIQRVRNQIQHSNYLAHHGDCKKFIEKFDCLLNDYEPSEKTKMVLLSDGATWIDNWRKNHEIEWIAILDYYHVTEKLHEIAKLFLSKEHKEIWVEKNCKLLLEGDLDEVLKSIENLESINNDKLEKRDILIKHFQKNRTRMNYVEFIKQGLYIGSGFIESAHKYVVQKRMKLSGQRWGSGMQGMLNLRCCSQSNKWSKVVNIINEQCFKNAA